MKITLPNKTVIELDDKQPMDVVPQTGDVAEKNSSSGDPVATEKRGGQIAPEPKPAPAPTMPPPMAEAQPTKSEEKPQPAASTSLRSFDLQGGKPDILDPNKGKPGYFYFVAPKEE